MASFKRRILSRRAYAASKFGPCSKLEVLKLNLLERAPQPEDSQSNEIDSCSLKNVFGLVDGDLRFSDDSVELNFNAPRNK